ncbi:hypothetical protein [Clostridium botulinum]|uniref:hypothetical protein n=1 Tax=Clostridium botulinum TaxID=1491 RepID=UPI0004DA9191|nr:hypothetical protein [Clostridium botulinum]KEH96814.1 hypothetical protein Z953_13800 [Clostridium botulinum D str. 16868]NFF61915.1 hypothetical protein [Clostridium botulinum]NFL03661.1 hypothetical protein [Clostridium botulinum]
MDHPSRTKKDKRISKILTIIVAIFITLILLLRLGIYLIAKPDKTKIEMVTNQNDTFIVYEYDKFLHHHDYYYRIYEKVPGKIFSTKVPVLNVHAGSIDEKLTKDDFFYTYTKYKYKNKEVKVYSGKNNSYNIFKVEGSSNYIYGDEEDILSSYLSNDYSYYEYLVPIYLNLLKNLKEKNIRYISGVLLIFDVTESFPIITQNINRIDDEKIRENILKYIKNYPKSKQTKHDLIYKIFLPSK